VGPSNVTDAGMKDIAKLSNLSWLHLSYTKVTDAGLKELANLRNLRTLELNFTHVTDAGVDQLQKALPDCVINYPRPHFSS
jgi:Leucine-rich repeat (LRR) protein